MFTGTSLEHTPPTTLRNGSQYKGSRETRQVLPKNPLAKGKLDKKLAQLSTDAKTGSENDLQVIENQSNSLLDNLNNTETLQPTVTNSETVPTTSHNSEILQPNLNDIGNLNLTSNSDQNLQFPRATTSSNIFTEVSN